MENKIFDLFLGLPVHVLITHVVVVLLPISAFALILLVFLPKLRKNYLLLTLIGLGVSVVAAFIAKESGEALSYRVGTPSVHTEWGEKTLIVAVLLFISALVWQFLLKKKNRFTFIIGYLVAILAITAIVISYLAGHSGAKASWEKRINPVSQVTDSSGTATNSLPAENSGPIELSMNTVAQKNTPENCWAVVSNQVYNLTAYITAHPGGAANITNLCGTDATAAFTNEHGQSSKPNTALKSFVIGALGSTIQSLPTPDPAAIANSGDENEEEEEEEENEGDED
jgi:cytochrome b involved in lipid metabolism